jgi:hypothetical protein
MTSRCPILAAAAILMLGVAGATAGGLPSYDVGGFPGTPHQMSVLGQSGGVQEQPPAPSPLREGMPASPHQIAVLSHRPARTAPSFGAAQTQIRPITRSMR